MPYAFWNKNYACQRAWKKKNPDKVRAQDRRRKLRRHGLTPATYEALLAAQQGRCANPGCRTEQPGKIGWVIDHDHVTGRVRGILCAACNLALGHAQDNAIKLRGLADYVERYK